MSHSACHKVIMEKKQHVHKICGMDKNTAIYIRKQVHSGKSSEIFAKLSSVLRNLFPDYKVGVIFGTFVLDHHCDTNLEEDIIFSWISDETDIDSKCITFISDKIKPLDQDAIWSRTYRLDLTKL